MKFACYLAAAVLISAGAAHAEPRALSGFNRVSASAGTDVRVQVGPAFRVDVTGRDAERITTRVVDGRLIVQPVRTWFWQTHNNAVVHVTMPAIAGLEASSGANIEARGVNGGAIDLETSSGGELDVAGTCASFTAEASSGADLNAANLRCESGRVSASSGASARVFASNRLDVDASSGGDIIASGNPGFGDVSMSSGGSLRRAN